MPIRKTNRNEDTTGNRSMKCENGTAKRVCKTFKRDGTGQCKVAMEIQNSSP